MQALTKPPAHRMVPSQQRPFDVPRQRVREQHLGKEAKIRVPAPFNIYVKNTLIFTHELYIHMLHRHYTYDAFAIIP
jgi:hypothetical protein